MKKLLIAALLPAAFALPASAATFDWGVHDATEAGVSFTAPGVISDTFTFSLSGLSDLSVAATSIPVPSFSSIPFASLYLFDSSDTLIGGFVFGDSAAGADVFEDLAAGSYYYKIFGVSAGFGGSFYSVASVVTAVTPPVPEPETYAMLLAGLGMMGLVASRRLRG